MRAPRRHPPRFLAAALLAATLAVVACQPRLGGARTAGETGLASSSEAAAADPAPAPGPGAVDVSAAAPVGEAEPLSHFGLLTPLFPGVGSQAVSAPCEPDDFYGGCL